MKRIYCLRHAKAVTGDAAARDADRALAPIGEIAARQMGDYMRGAGLIPDTVVCSDARRTRETLQLVLPSFDPAPDVTYSERLYLASAGELLRQIHALPDSVSSVLLVGHNPGMHQFSLQLAQEGDGDAWDDLSLSFPTASLAVFECDAPSWRMIEPGDCNLLSFVSPKKLPVESY